MARTRIKLCGLTREEDVASAVAAGADAIGFVFYPRSPRYVTPQRAAVLARGLPPFVTTVGLFVNADAAEVRQVLEALPLDLLQFHGMESEHECKQFGLPYIKAVQVAPGCDLVKSALDFSSARGLLADAASEGFGGSGKTFDWNLVPPDLPLPLILSGGLDAGNVTEGIRRLKPWAVDVSSGVESAKGIKDPARIAAFVAAVKRADA